MKTELELQDVQTLATAVFELLKPLLKGSIKAEDKDTILDVQGLAEYLRVNVSWVHKQVQLKTIPYFKAGKYLRFKKSVVEKWIDAETIRPVQTFIALRKQR